MGNHFYNYLKFRNKNVSLRKDRIKNYVDIIKIIDDEKPDVIINCIGRTGYPNVDWCEYHQKETFEGNVNIPKLLAEHLYARGIYWTHLSSGCVYAGDNNEKGFSEEDKPNFDKSIYSASKIAGEKVLKKFDNILIARLRIPFEGNPNNKNAITKITHYKRIINIKNSMSYVPNFIEATLKLIKLKQIGKFNITNPGSINHKEILDLYKAIVDPEFEYTIMSEKELLKEVKAPRSNCILNTSKLEKFIKLPSIKEAIIMALMRYEKTNFQFIPPSINLKSISPF